MHSDRDNQTEPVASESKNPIHVMEIDDSLPLPDPRMSRFMPWFTRQHPPDDTIDGIMSGVSFGESSVAYYGMGDVHVNLSTQSVAGSHPSTPRFQRLRQGLLRSFSFGKSRTQDDSDDADDESLADFKDWTPPDSAYGAAFPICGWVPKHTRRAIEITIIALFVFALVYFVVTTSIRITNDQASSSNSSTTSSSNSESSGSNNKLADDDYYIDNESDYKYSDDAKEDDYFREMDDFINADGSADDEDANENGNGRQFLRLF